MLIESSSTLIKVNPNTSLFNIDRLIKQKSSSMLIKVNRLINLKKSSYLRERQCDFENKFNFQFYVLSQFMQYMGVV